MSVTDAVARAYSISPLEVMSARAEDVIDVLNFMLEKGGEKDGGKTHATPRNGKARKLVDEKTASGGWY